jgi:hypothetical protein
LGELRKELQNLSEYNDSEFHSLALPTECFNHKFEGNVLESAIYDLVFDNGPIELGNLLKILHWVLVKEAVLIEKAVKHASIDFLLFFQLRIAESLHYLDEFTDFLIDLIWFSGKYSLEIVVCSIVNFLGVLCRGKQSRELFPELGIQISYLITSLRFNEWIVLMCLI